MRHKKSTVTLYAHVAALLAFACAQQTSAQQLHVNKPHARQTAAPQQHPNPSGLEYTTSWFGNTFGGSDINPKHTDLHVPLDMNNIFVSGDGTVYTNTPWEEGGRPVSVFRNGELISQLDDSPTSQNWSNGGGVAVAAHGAYIFKGNGPNGTGVTVLNASNMIPAPVNLTGSSTLNNAHGIFGMAVAKGKLYVTEDDMSVVDVFDLSTLTLDKSYSIPHPVRIAVDSEGGLWVSHRNETPLPEWQGNVYDIDGQMGLPAVDHYDASGAWVNSIKLPDGGEVGALWIDRHGALYVGDDGPDQNIKVYANLLTVPVQLFTLGVKGGDYAAGVGKVPGDVGPWRFRGITGIGTDQQDNLYVSQSGFGLDMGVGHGAVLQSYSWWGALTWQVEGLEFVSLATIDPHSETDAYDAYHHFKLDFSKTGNIGSYVADTYQRFKYPDDVRVTSIAATGQIRYIQGHKFLLVGGQGTSYLEIERFDPGIEGKEIAVPSAAFDLGSLNGDYKDFVVQPVDAEFIWRDMNGDGQMSMDEIVEPVTEKGWRAGGNFWLDADGNMWESNWDFNTEGPLHLRRYLFQGFDSYGNPVYDFDHVQIFNAPVDFPGLNDIERAVFEADASAGGTLYAAGNQGSLGTFTQIVRYDNWDKGVRKPKWVIDVPWDPDPNNTWQPNSFSISGEYLFLDYYRPHVVLVFALKDGSYIGKFEPGADIGGVGRIVDGVLLSPVGDTDEWQGISSFLRSNGEYVVINEDDFQSKQIVYRWTPGHVEPPPPPQPPSNVAATGTDEGVTLTWTPSPGSLIYTVSRSSIKGGPYTVVDTGVVGNSVTDFGLINGQTYYYVVSALTETGASGNSAEAAGAAVAQGTTYEAETAQLAGGDSAYLQCARCSGGGKVIALIPGATIAWTSVTVSQAGTYALRIYYCNGDQTITDFSTAYLTANGGTPIPVPPMVYTGDWETPGYVRVNVPLQAGANTIVFGVPANSSSGAPDIDRLLVPYQPN